MAAARHGAKHGGGAGRHGVAATAAKGRGSDDVGGSAEQHLSSSRSTESSLFALPPSISPRRLPYPVPPATSSCPYLAMACSLRRDRSRLAVIKRRMLATFLG
uniref:Uncharacterized protein n=1 Tax=Leersia perrieri TaxID=77586 RepID=A0A0D9X1D8_9ORYZ